jgi:hypothetical protein
MACTSEENKMFRACCLELFVEQELRVQGLLPKSGLHPESEMHEVEVHGAKLWFCERCFERVGLCWYDRELRTVE